SYFNIEIVFFRECVAENKIAVCVCDKILDQNVFVFAFVPGKSIYKVKSNRKTGNSQILNITHQEIHGYFFAYQRRNRTLSQIDGNASNLLRNPSMSKNAYR